MSAGGAEAAGLRVELSVERRPRSGEPFRLEAAFGTGRGVTVVFGPSGAGKSTLLLAILGGIGAAGAPGALLRGRILLDGRTLLDTEAGVERPVRERRIGIVFQDALLFPHMDVLRNVEFAVRDEDGSRPGRRLRRRRALETLERAGAAGVAERMPSELSGGQRQRVALARALAARPRALLLDEPFSSLDAPSREALGSRLLELQAGTGIPFVHVTHDLAEAVRLGTGMLVLDGGRVVQSGPPAEIAAAPASAAAARAVGTENLLTGTVLRHRPEEGLSEVDLGGVTVETALLPDAPGRRVALGLRADDVLVCLEPVRRTSARNLLPATVRELERRGPAVEVRAATPVLLRALVTPASAKELSLAAGREVYLLVKARSFRRLE